MTDRQEKERYLAAMRERRGYVLDYHATLVEHDLPLMKVVDEVVDAAYLSQRRLSAREKELIFIVSLTVLQAPKAHIESHINKALNIGVDPRDILEAIEISLPEAGVVAFQQGVEAWQSVMDRRGDAAATS